MYLAREIVVPVVFDGDMKPAFPKQLFSVTKVDHRGKAVKFVPVTNVSSFIAQDDGRYALNISFAPRGSGFYRISLKGYVGGSKGPTFELITRKRKLKF